MYKGYRISEPFFEFGPKCYLYGDRLAEIAKGFDRLSEKYGIDVILDVPDTEISRVARVVRRVHVYSQHMDSIPVGRGMGRTLPEALKAAGAVGCMLNHAEHKLTLIKEADLNKGALDKAVPVDYTVGPVDTDAPNTVELRMLRKVFPHVFGTDSSGRDLMARTMYGGRVSIAVGIIAALIVLVIGSIYGSVSGLAGGKVDFVMMRLVDIIYSVPDVLIVLLLQVVLKSPLQAWLDASGSDFARLMSNLGVGIVSIFITFACLYWVGMSRIVRGQVLQLKQQEFVTAATALGVPGARIVKRHLLPNCVGQLVIATCLQIPSAIFLESFLSFLGLGVSIPMTSLGSLCSDALDTITLYPYRLLYPGLILTLLVLSLNLVGDGIRDALDPRLKK